MSSELNPFAPPRRTNSMKLPPPKPVGAPPSLPPPPPNTSSSLTNLSDGSGLRQQIYKYETMYKQTKNQLEILKSQFRAQDKELNTFKTQKHVIQENHANIVHWQKKIADIELENETLMDKNGIFLQQKNQFLLQLTDMQQQCEEYRMQLRQKCEEYQRLELQYTSSTQNYTQQLSKKEEKYKNLKQEYLALNDEFKQKNCEHQSMKQELKTLLAQLKDVSEQNLLNKDKYEKLDAQHQRLQSQQEQLQTQISQVNEDSGIAVQLASKKDKSIIKDLRATMKAETIKCQQFKAENALLKDELNDLRDWRENYLRQQTLQKIQQSSPAPATTSHNGEEIADNVSTTSSASNQTSSSKTSREKDSRNHITYKEKIKIKIYNARSSIPVPSLSNLISNELGHSASDVAMNGSSAASASATAATMSSTASSSSPPPPAAAAAVMTKEHDEVIEALSDRLAIVKENYANLKTVIVNKDEEIGKLHFELEKKKELIADLIEKLVDKPLPPTPTEISEEEMKQNMMAATYSNNTHRKPSPPSMPPPVPKVIVSPSYNKGIGHGTYFTMPAAATVTHVRDTADNDQDDVKTSSVSNDNMHQDSNNGDGI